MSPGIEKRTIDWLMEGDWNQHALGFLHFRINPWGFPLGKIDTIAAPVGTNIAFTDSNPWLCLLLKPFGGILPTDFQFIGPWRCLCFMLQGVAGAWLGWRFTNSLPEEAIAGVSGFLPLTGPMTWCSKHRHAALAEFEIAAEAIPIEELVGSPYDVDDSVWNIETLCGLVDERLAASGLRLTSEDEFEAACAGSLFAWGMTIPDGAPYGSKTSFEEHRKPNAYDLMFNHDPYKTELARCAL